MSTCNAFIRCAAAVIAINFTLQTGHVPSPIFQGSNKWEHRSFLVIKSSRILFTRWSCWDSGPSKILTHIIYSCLSCSANEMLHSSWFGAQGSGEPPLSCKKRKESQSLRVNRANWEIRLNSKDTSAGKNTNLRMLKAWKQFISVFSTWYILKMSLGKTASF